MTKCQVKRELRAPGSDEKLFYDLQMGIFGGQAFLVAYDLGLFSLLAKAPLAVAQVGEKLGLAPRSAEAMLILCTSLGLLERQQDAFALTPLSEDYLLPDSPTYIGDFIRPALFGQPELTSFPSVKRAIVENRWQIYEGENCSRPTSRRSSAPGSSP